MFIRPILSLIISNQRRKKKRKILSSEHDNNKTQPINFFLPISLYFSGKNNSLLNYSNKLITPFFEIRKRLYLQYILLSFLCFKDTPFIQHKKRLYFHFPAFLFITHKLKPKYSSKTLSFSEKKKMGEEHHHAPPPVQAPPAGPPPPNLALSRGPVWNPAEQLLQLHYCIHSNPSWR